MKNIIFENSKKKMKFYLILIFIILLNDQIYCLKPDDFCKKDNRKTKSCIAYNCGKKYCAFDTKTCDHLISWDRLLKKWIKEPKIYKNFLSKIRNCKKNDYRND